MTDKAQVLAALEPLMDTVTQVDPTDPAGAVAALEAAHPFEGLDSVRRLLFAARDEGWLTPRTATPTLTYGRLAKASENAQELGIEVVDMSGAGPEHTHPNGEINLCFPEAGTPLFEGCPGGWVVMPPDSHHTPDVQQGRMLIVYFLPGGAIQFGPRA